MTPDGVVAGVLAGGVPFLAMDRPACGVVSLQIWIGAGSRMEIDRPGSGVAHFLEHLVFKGTARRTAGEINRQAERLGGFLNAYTSYDRTVYHLDLPSDRAGEGLDLLADFVWTPSLVEEGFASERDVILREIGMYRDDPDSVLFDAIMEAAFREDLLRYPVIGLEERFRVLGLEDLRRFHADHYRSRNILLLLAGDLPDGLLDRGEKISPVLGSESESDCQARRFPTSEEPAPVRLRLSGNWEGGRGTVLYHLPTTTLREILLAEWAVEVLGGGESSLLSARVRMEKGLVHFFDGFLHSLGGTSLLGFSWMADGDRLEETEVTVMEELDRLGSEDLPEEILIRGKSRWRFQQRCQRESVDGWASRSGELLQILGSAPTFAEENSLLESLGSKDLRQFLHQYASPARALAGQLRYKG